MRMMKSSLWLQQHFQNLNRFLQVPSQVFSVLSRTESRPRFPLTDPVDDQKIGTLNQSSKRTNSVINSPQPLRRHHATQQARAQKDLARKPKEKIKARMYLLKLTNLKIVKIHLKWKKKILKMNFNKEKFTDVAQKAF